MANYVCTIRTNYFRVKDAKKFEEIMENVASECGVEIFSRTDKNRDEWFGFGCYGNIYGIENDCDNIDCKDVDYDYDSFIKKLQNCVMPDDAIIIFESGNEKLRYIIGSALIITESDAHIVNIKDLAVEKAREMLKNPNFDTRCYY